MKIKCIYCDETADLKLKKVIKCDTCEEDTSTYRIKDLSDSTKLCYLDGNALCITGINFVNLQESKTMFITLTSEQLDEFKAMSR